jgi:hypothetical protein
MHYFAMFDEHSLDTNLYFLHRGVIDPKSGIGHHFHNQCEEMFVHFRDLEERCAALIEFRTRHTHEWILQP